MRYTVHAYNAVCSARLGIVCDELPNVHGVPQQTLMSRGYSAQEAHELASWLNQRHAGYNAPDPHPVRYLPSARELQGYNWNEPKHPVYGFR